MFNVNVYALCFKWKIWFLSGQHVNKLLFSYEKWIVNNIFLESNFKITEFYSRHLSTLNNIRIIKFEGYSNSEQDLETWYAFLVQGKKILYWKKENSNFQGYLGIFGPEYFLSSNNFDVWKLGNRRPRQKQQQRPRLPKQPHWRRAKVNFRFRHGWARIFWMTLHPTFWLCRLNLFLTVFSSFYSFLMF